MLVERSNKNEIKTVQLHKSLPGRSRVFHEVMDLFFFVQNDVLRCPSLSQATPALSLVVFITEKHIRPAYRFTEHR